MKLRRDDERNKSAYAYNSHNSNDHARVNKLHNMGQSHSTDIPTGNKISKNFEPKLALADQIGESMLAANYRDDETLHKVIALVKNASKAKIKALDCP